MSKIKRVLIVGAGLAGLSLAISLRRQGINTDIVERHATWPIHGAGIYLVGNAIRALRAIKVDDEVLSKGSIIKTQTLLNHRGKTLAVINTESVWGNCGPCIGMRRTDLQDILVSALGTGNLQFSTTVSAIEHRGDKVFARFNDNNQQSYDLVVGADGIRSSVRQHLFGDASPRYTGFVGWRFLTRCPESITGWTLFTGRRGVFLFIPVGGGTAYCYADAEVAKPLDDPIEGRLERLRSRFAEYTSPVSDVLAELQSSDQIHFGAIEDIWQETWSERNVLLIGDAAHATSPNMASGAAMAFEDSLVLSELISSDREVSQIIAEYSRRRIPRVRWVHEQTLKRDRIRRLHPIIRDVLTRRLAHRVYRANYLPLIAEV